MSARVRSFSIMLIVMLVLTTLTGCCTDPVNGERYFCLFGEVSDAEEARLGKQYAPDFIAQSGGVYPDPELNRRLGRIVIDEMALKSQRPGLPWEFTILNTSQINAFALPGGKVFVTRGLLARLDSEAQFAHLMGHEVGHVTHRHSVRGQSRQQLFTLLLGAIAVGEQAARDDDSDDPLWATQIAGVAGQLTLLKFSRDQELQSDKRGVDYALAAGYDAREARKTFAMFLELKTATGGSENAIAALFATHPLDSKRIAEIDAYIQAQYPDLAAGSREVTVSSPDWDKLVAGLRNAQGIYQEYESAMALISQAREQGNRGALDTAEARIRSCSRRLPRHATFHVGLGVLNMERDDLAGAQRALDRACQLDPNLFEARYTRGILHRRVGQGQRAVTDLRAAAELFPSSPMPPYQLGQVYDGLGDRPNATAWYKSAVERSAPGGTIHTSSRERLATLAGGQ